MTTQETDETGMRRTYRGWMEHAAECGQCSNSPNPSDGCDVGRELWGAYRLARIGRGAS
ncbi:hypothetical protein GCM10023080_098330 [Streptomyces pseudoechinosporeus]